MTEYYALQKQRYEIEQFRSQHGLDLLPSDSRLDEIVRRNEPKPHEDRLLLKPIIDWLGECFNKTMDFLFDQFKYILFGKWQTRFFVYIVGWFLFRIFLVLAGIISFGIGSLFLVTGTAEGNLSAAVAGAGGIALAILFIVAGWKMGGAIIQTWSAKYKELKERQKEQNVADAGGADSKGMESDDRSDPAAKESVPGH